MNTPAPTPTTHAGEPDALVRRARYTVSTALLLTAATAVCLLTAFLADRARLRFDATGTREHSLAPRTLRILDSIPEPTTIAVCADSTRNSPRAWRRVSDLLDTFARRSPRLTSTLIDTSRADAAAQVQSLLASLARRDHAKLLEHADALDRAQRVLSTLPTQLASLATTASDRAREHPGTPAADAVSRAAAILKLAATDLEKALDTVTAARDHGPEYTTDSATTARLPESDLAQKAASPALDAAIKAIGALITNAPHVPDIADPVVLSSLRDQLADTADRLTSLKPLEPLLVARMLRAQQGVLVFSPRGTTAIDFDAMFPPAPQASPAGAEPDIFAGEELLSTAVASLNQPSRPILVLVHAERERLLDDSARPVGPALSAIARLADRLALRRVDLAEWPVALEPARPAFPRLDPLNERPKVWFVLPAPARTNADPRKGLSLADRAQRVGKLADALTNLLDARQNTLVTLEPSELPAVGEPDPVADALKPWGLSADTARPLIERIGTPRGLAISCYQTLRATDKDTPIAQAIDSLPTILHWPMPVTITPSPGVHADPILTVASSPSVWGESAWMPMRYANARQPFQALAPPDPPTPDPARDNTSGPFTVAVSAQRENTSHTADPPQRLVLVSSPGWFEDLYTQASSIIDGRRVWLFPGNTELFEAAFHWLARMDELIAPSPRVRDIPRIDAMTPGRAALIRWILIAALPLGVLLLAWTLRVIRG